MTSIIKQTTRSVLKWFRRKRVKQTLELIFDMPFFANFRHIPKDAPDFEH